MNIELTDKEVEFLMRVLLNNYAEEQQDFEQDNISDIGISAFLIGKLVAGKSNLRKLFYQIKDERFLVQDRITQYLFMGAGWHSLVAANNLHKRIRQAIYILGGMQQNGGMGTEFDEESEKQDKQSLKEIALDVLTAFGLTVEDLK